MSMAIRKHYKDFIAILFLVLLSAGVAYYILTNQRLRFPFIQPQRTQIKAEFQTAQAVTPGQGQTVRISGVKVGDITKVDLKDGVAVITMDIDPAYDKRIRTDASALLRPKTGLKDMFVEINPGKAPAPVAKNGWTIPLKSTLPDVNPDEILSALDTDTRGYLQLLVKGAGQGLDKRGGDLAEVFKRFEPTHRDLARFAKAVAQRRANVRDLTTALAELNGALADRRKDLVQLVDSSSAVFGALAKEDNNISTAVRLLPGTLRDTTITLRKVQRFANILGPSSRALIPAIREIPDANRALSSLARAETGDVKNKIRPFVRAARPVVRDLRPSVNDLARATPKLTSSFVVLNHLFNTLAFNPNGAEPPEKADRQEGFLFWLAWLNHQALTLFSSQDANGGFRPLFLTLGCSSARQLIQENASAEFALNLTPILTNPALCGSGQTGGLGLPSLPNLPSTPVTPSTPSVPSVPLPLKKQQKRGAQGVAGQAKKTAGTVTGSTGPAKPTDTANNATTGAGR
jgi:phospholipid/cholesterol/gamma-HCH transport system substrate-binding protein